MAIEMWKLSVAGVSLFPCLVQVLHCFWMLLEIIGQVCGILALQLIATRFLSPSFCLYFDYTSALIARPICSILHAKFLLYLLYVYFMFALLCLNSVYMTVHHQLDGLL